MWLIIFSIELHVLSCAISLFRLCFSPWFCIICFACNCLWSLMLFSVFSRSYCNLREDLMKTEHAVMFLIDSNSVFQILFPAEFSNEKIRQKKKEENRKQMKPNTRNFKVKNGSSRETAAKGAQCAQKKIIEFTKRRWTWITLCTSCICVYKYLYAVCSLPVLFAASGK